jgi:hypothetical protein
MFQKEINFDRFVRGIMFLAAIVVAYLLLDYLSAVLIPFFAAWIVAYILFPIVDFFQNKCHLRSRLLSILVTVLLIGGIIFGCMQLIWPVIVEQVGHIKEVASRYMGTMPTNSSIPAAVQNFINENAESLSVENLLREHDVQNFLKNAMGKVWSFAWSTVGIIVSILSSLIALIYLFFLLLDYEKFAKAFEADSQSVRTLLIGRVDEDGNVIEEGILTRLEALIDETIDSAGGYFERTEDSFDRQITRLDNKIVKGNEAIERYRERLEKKYMSMNILNSNVQTQYQVYFN